MWGFRCKWCHGRGCTFCPTERAKWEAAEEKRRMEPILTARFDDPQEMEEFKQVMGREAIEKAFGPGGGGVQEIERNAAIVSLTRLLRKHTYTDGTSVTTEPERVEPQAKPQPQRPPRQEGLFDSEEDEEEHDEETDE
jgi:hypothetical protein